MTLLQSVEGSNRVHHELADPDSFWQKMEDQFAAQKQEGILKDYNYTPGKSFSAFDLILPLLIVGLILLVIGAFV